MRYELPKRYPYATRTFDYVYKGNTLTITAEFFCGTNDWDDPDEFNLLDVKNEKGEDVDFKFKYLTNDEYDDLWSKFIEIM